MAWSREGVTSRLEEARLLRGARSISSIAQELPERSRTYSTVYRYFKGEIDPPVSFLADIADMLDVRLAWLVAGDGLPTEPEQLNDEVDLQVARLQGAGHGATRHRRALLDGLLQGLGVKVADAYLAPLERFVWNQWHGQGGDGDVAPIAILVGETVAKVLRALGIQPRRGNEPLVEFYLPFVVPAVLISRHLLPGSEKDRPSLAGPIWGTDSDPKSGPSDEGGEA